MGDVGPPSPPGPLQAEHDLSGFDCGVPALNDWLRQRGLRNQRLGGSRTYVVAIGWTVIAYYNIAVGSVSRIEGTKDLQRNMPDPLPIMVLGRLAVDLSRAGMGLGAGLLRDAILRTVQVAQTAGLAAMVVHAKDEAAARFYVRHGFRASPLRDLTLMLPVSEMLGQQ